MVIKLNTDNTYKADNAVEPMTRWAADQVSDLDCHLVERDCKKPLTIK